MLRSAFLGRTQIPFDMFDLERTAEEARRGVKLASLYHRGQELAWDGRAVLAELEAKHGGVQVPEGQRDALAHVFGVIMWGELAAWKISAQLADEIVPLEAKMAATSQAHDEARHFYVMYDYLTRLGHVPKRMDRASRVVLDLVLETRSLAKKLLGMQLMVESLALTIFQAVREARPEPVLADLLRYYEKDEARHVGLGTQLLPQMIKRMSKAEALGLFVFQMQILGWTIAGLKSMEPHLRVLGISPRRILDLGRAKQTLAFQTMWDQLGIKEIPRPRTYVIRTIKAVAGALFDEGDGSTALGRALRGWREGLDAGMPETSLSPDEEPRRVTVTLAT
jgi:hypothetical protein